MLGKARIGNHPIHPVLIVFPVGLLTTAGVLDLLYIITDNARWADYAYVLMAGGLVGGVLAAIAGAIDFISIPTQSAAKRVAGYHGAINGVVMVLYGVSFVLRSGTEVHIPTNTSLAASFIALGLMMISGWLGGELMSRYGVGVSDGAHVNAS